MAAEVMLLDGVVLPDDVVLPGDVVLELAVVVTLLLLVVLELGVVVAAELALVFALVLLLEAVVPFAGVVVLLAAVVGGALVEFPVSRAQPKRSNLMEMWLFQSKGLTRIHLAMTGQSKLLVTMEFSSVFPTKIVSLTVWSPIGCQLLELLLQSILY